VVAYSPGQASRLQLPSLAGDELERLGKSRVRVRVGVQHSTRKLTFTANTFHIPTYLLNSVVWSASTRTVILPTRVNVCDQSLRLRQDALPPDRLIK
jgi:hypothetical protein